MIKSLSAIFVSCALLVLLSVNWATTTMAGLDEPLYRSDLAAFGAALVLALLVQIAVVAVLYLATQSTALAEATAALFCVANAWSMNLLLAEGFAELSLVWKALILAGAFIITFLVIHISGSGKFRFGVVGFVVAAIIVGNIATFSLKSVAAPTDVRSGDTSGQATTGTNRINTVRFKKTPNVYVIGFESAAPAALLSKHLGLETAPLPAAVEGHAFRVFPNAFAEGNYTRQSWHRFLSMDATYAAEHEDAVVRNQLFSGMTQSPFFQIFRDNGYEITTLYKSSYLGTVRGPHVDHYIIGQPFSPCDHGFLPKELETYFFWDACYLRKTWFRQRGTDPIKQLRDVLVEAGRSAKPQLVIAHTDKPTHTVTGGLWTGSDEDVRAFRESYVSTSRKAVDRLGIFMDAIQASDHPAILLVMGDHGPILSRGLSFKDNPTFYVQDQYGVLAGVYPKNACKSTFDEGAAQGYVTTPQLGRLIIKCLADGQDPFQEPYTHRVLEDDFTVDFSKYVYE